jgi:hypothetical protein
MLPANLRRAAIGIAVCLAVLLVGVRDRETGRIVSKLTPLYDARPGTVGGSGALVSAVVADPGIYFNPYLWSGAHYVRARRAVLLNAPWIYGPMAVITPRERHPWDGLGPETMGDVLPLQRANFVCGGTPAPVAPGMVRVFASDWYHCDKTDEASRAVLR